MSVLTITRTHQTLADSVERGVVNSLISEPEGSISDAPAYSPEAAGLLLLLILLSPKEPTEPRRK